MKVKIKTKDEYFDFVKLKCSAVEFLAGASEVASSTSMAPVLRCTLMTPWPCNVLMMALRSGPGTK